MAQIETTTYVIVKDGNEKRLSAVYDQEIVTFKLGEKEVFRMDGQNFAEFSKILNSTIRKHDRAGQKTD